MSAHTPGPWVFIKESGTPGKDDNDMGGIHAPGVEVVCWFGNGTTYYPSEGSPPSEANGRLMASAPELLAALKDVVGWVPGSSAFFTDGSSAAVERARAAIAKAEGRA